MLRRSGANGQLTVEELDERVEAAYAARTRGELERLVEDLGEIARAPCRRARAARRDDGTHWVVSIMGGSDRRGRWRVGRTCTVVNVMGGSDLDLNDAEFAGDVVELRVFSLMGGSDDPDPRRPRRRGVRVRAHGRQRDQGPRAAPRRRRPAAAAQGDLGHGRHDGPSRAASGHGASGGSSASGSKHLER